MPSSTPRLEAQIILQNLRNALIVWGEGSRQYKACVALAEGILQDAGVVREQEASEGVEGTGEGSAKRMDELVKELEGLVLRGVADDNGKRG